MKKIVVSLLIISSSIYAQNMINERVDDINGFKMLQYVNSVRAKGAKCMGASSPLKWSNSLEKAAKSHSTDMAMNNFLQHYGSGTIYDEAGYKKGKRSTFIDRIEYFGFPLNPGELIGENLALIYRKKGSSSLMSNFKRAVKNWLDDRPHCIILMNPRFTNIGIGYYKKGNKYYFSMDLVEVK